MRRATVVSVDQILQSGALFFRRARAGGPRMMSGSKGTVRGSDSITPVTSRQGTRYEHITDDEVMAAVQAGETLALSELVRRFWTPLVSYAFRLLENVDGAEDVVQETFARVWERRAEWRSTGSVKAFLYVIARRLALNETRRIRRRRFFFRRHRQELDAFSSPTDSDFDDDMRAAVNAAVAALPARQREIFVLARYHRLSHAEIAETLGISRATVSNHMTAALKRLRRELKGVAESH